MQRGIEKLTLLNIGWVFAYDELNTTGYYLFLSKTFCDYNKNRKIVALF